MRSSHTFPNLFNPNIGFAYHASDMDLWDQSRRHDGWILTRHASYFETYGDGNVQHTPNMLCGVNHFFEWCASFADYILKTPDLELPMYALGLPTVRRADVEFLLSVKHKEDKRTYMDRRALKVSSNENKRFDKRWVEVPAFADGTVDSAFGLWDYTTEFTVRNQFLERFHLLKKVREYGDEILGYYCKPKAESEFEALLNRETGINHGWVTAYHALISAMEQRESLRDAKRMLESCADGYQRWREEAQAVKGTLGATTVAPVETTQPELVTA